MSAKNRILDCAERLVIREGVAHLTLDAVAADAGLSKGGILYHFPSKDALIEGMIAHLMETAHAAIARSIEADPEPRGRYTRAILAVNFPEPASELEQHNQVASALLAAVVINRALLEPVKGEYRNLDASLRADGIDPVRARIVQLAADGLWISGMLGLPGPDPALRRQLIDRLYQMTRE